MENPAEKEESTNSGIKQQLPDSTEGITDNGMVILETDVDKIVLIDESDSSETKMKGDVTNISDERTCDSEKTETELGDLNDTGQQTDSSKSNYPANGQNIESGDSGNYQYADNVDSEHRTNEENKTVDINELDRETKEEAGIQVFNNSDDELPPNTDDDYDIVDGLFKLRKIFCGKGSKEDQDDPPYLPSGKFEKIYQEEEIRHQYRPAYQRTSHGREVTPESIHRGITRQLSQPKDPPHRDRGKYSMKERTNRRVMSQVDSDHYYFGHIERGYMLVIINDTFAHQSPRDGAIHDLRNMREIARKFGFRILNYRFEMNLSKPDVIFWLEKARTLDHSDCDCFAFMISTHGFEQKNALVGGKEDHALVCADDQIIFTSSITSRFSDERCPSLKSKPKFFFIQACRGESLDHGSNVRVLQSYGVDKTCAATLDNYLYRRARSVDMCDTKPQSDSWRTADYHHDPYSTSIPQDDTRYMAQMKATMHPNWIPAKQNTSHNPHSGPHHTNHQKLEPVSSRAMPNVTPGNQSAQTPYAIVDTPSIHCDNDMLVMYAIPPGYFAWRNSMDGSWMIHYLNKVLMAYDFRKPKNFLSLLTKVNWQMSERNTNAPMNNKLHEKKAVSVLEHKLTRDVIFVQKVAMSHWQKMAL